MLTLHFGGRLLGGLAALEISRQAEGEAMLERWQARIEVSGATPASAERGATLLEGALAGQGSLEVREGANVLRRLPLAACADGPALERLLLNAGDDANAHPQRIFRLQFLARLGTSTDSATPAPAAQETIITLTTRRIVDLPLLAPGAPPWRQETGAPLQEIVQEGQAGHDAPLPPPLLPQALVEQRVERHAGTDLPGLRWRYVMRPLFFVFPQGESRP